MVGVIARSIDSGDFEKLVEKIPPPDQRKKWQTARSGFSEAELENATDKIVYAPRKVSTWRKTSGWWERCTPPQTSTSMLCME